VLFLEADQTGLCEVQIWEMMDGAFAKSELVYINTLKYDYICLLGYTYEVGQKAPALHVLMSEIDPSNAATYGQNAMTFFNQYLTQSIPHTPKVHLYSSCP
jgi:hypothetical protein